jgi:NADH:ubiquinone oxidoreductase subunit 5 (subunit L)/multisubunit Na+/H+ antiporter MnhA subunit
VVACALVVAAAARSALLPLQAWLPATLAAPTPVSALLHAGAVNAGGHPARALRAALRGAPVATHLAFVLGATTAVYGTALMLTKADVKGALAHSTMAQMGFMIMACAVGFFGAAVFHLVAHGMYKASLFLGSGGTVARKLARRRAAPAPAYDRRRLAAAGATAALLPALALGLGVLVLGAQHVHDDAALLVFAWACGARVAWGWGRRHPTPLGALALGAGLGVAATAYLAALGTLVPVLGSGLPADAAVSAWWLVPAAAALALVSLLRGAGAGLAGLRDAAYVWALGAAHTGARVRARPQPVRVPPLRVLEPLGGRG